MRDFPNYHREQHRECRAYSIGRFPHVQHRPSASSPLGCALQVGLRTCFNFMQMRNWDGLNFAFIYACQFNDHFPGLAVVVNSSWAQLTKQGKYETPNQKYSHSVCLMIYLFSRPVAPRLFCLLWQCVLINLALNSQTFQRDIALFRMKLRNRLWCFNDQKSTTQILNSLWSLILDTGIDFHGAKALADSLKVTSTLQIIDLSCISSLICKNGVNFSILA